MHATISDAWTVAGPERLAAPDNAVVRGTGPSWQQTGALVNAVVVVVLSWNKQEAVLDCIARIEALRHDDLQIVVVDNASSDDSVAAIRRAHPDVTVLEQAVNTGFAGGVNRGLAEADRRGADYAWLLNDDTVFDDDVVTALVDHAKRHPASGLLSPLLLDLTPEAEEQFRNGLVDWARGVMRHNVTAPEYARRLAAGATATVPGTALLCALRTYRTIGPFDERFFAYWEDTDYTMRAADAGLASEVVEAAVMRHAATPTRNDRPPHYHYYMVRNEALFWRLHGTKRKTRWKRRWLAATAESIAQNRDLGRIGNVDACIDGLWHAITRRYGARAAHAPAPRWLRRLLLAAPWPLVDLLEGRWSKLASALRRR